ncbi:MAG: hypothetical protein AAF609_04415 [Cyanobacteria bacterium P01_C01_bin.120]
MPLSLSAFFPNKTLQHFPADTDAANPRSRLPQTFCPRALYEDAAS